MTALWFFFGSINNKMIRTLFLLLVVVGSFLISRNYFRQERMLLFLDNYNTLLVRDDTNNWLLDQPSSTRTKSDSTISTISSSSSSSISISTSTRRRNIVPVSSSDDNDNDESDTREEEGHTKGGEDHHRWVRSGQLQKRGKIQNHTNNSTSNNMTLMSSGHTNTNIDVHNDVVSMLINRSRNDDEGGSDDHDHDTTNNITPITGIIPSQEEEEKEQQQQQQQKSPLPLSQSLLPLLHLDRPTDNNTVIMLVAMGKVSNTTWLAERCVLSIRTGGQFTGYIIVITDKEGYSKYSQTLTSITINGNNNHPTYTPTPNPTTGTNSSDNNGNDNSNSNSNRNSNSNDNSVPNNSNNNNKVIVIETKTEDISPKTKDGSTVRYYKKRTHMLYKRYKTLVLKYLEHVFNDNDDTGDGIGNNSIDHVLYLDIDNIVARPLSNFFDDYYNSINTQLADTATKTRTSIQQQLQLNTNKNKSKYTPTTITTSDNTNTNTNTNNNDSFVRSDSTNNYTTTTMSNNKKKEDSNIINNNSNTDTDFSFFSFWKDPHVKYKDGLHLWQSGQIMFSTKHSHKCVDAWRNEMDHNKHVMDQILLFNVYIQNNFGNTDHPNCLFFELPNNSNSNISTTTTSNDNNNNNSTSTRTIDSITNNDKKGKRKHFELLSRDITDIDDRSQYPTIVHLTQTRLDSISKYKNQDFLRQSLLLDDYDLLSAPGSVGERDVEVEVDVERGVTEIEELNNTENKNDNENELLIISRNSDTRNYKELVNSVKTISTTTKATTTRIVDGIDRHNAIKAENNIITWNNQTIGWNEIIKSFDGGKEKKKEKREEKKKKKKK